MRLERMRYGGRGTKTRYEERRRETKEREEKKAAGGAGTRWNETASPPPR